MRLQVIGLALLVASAMTWTEVRAQSSSVTLKPRPDGTMPEPAAVLQILDSEYPFDALLDNVEGMVSLNLLVGADGRVYFAQVLQSSGSPALDQAAAQIARTNWTFKPAQGGGAATASALVDVAWKLPLTPVNDYRFEVPPLPEGAQPPKAITSHAAGVNDYPAGVIRDGLQGILTLRYFVDEQGGVSRAEIIQSSGIKSLDDSASKMITQRWKFDPAKDSNGTPIGVWQGAAVQFTVRSYTFDRRRLGCHAKPIDPGENELVRILGELRQGAIVNGRDIIPPQPATLSFDVWTYVDASGAATDMVLWTKNGLMRVSRPVLDAIKQSGYRRPSEGGCWYFESPMVRR
jgi:TonB family protein